MLEEGFSFVFLGVIWECYCLPHSLSSGISKRVLGGSFVPLSGYFKRDTSQRLWL